MTDTVVNSTTLPNLHLTGDTKYRIQPLLVSRQYYNEKLSNLVSNDFLDLKVCYCMPDDYGTMQLISNGLLQALDIPTDFIRSQALENIRSSQSYGIRNLEEVLIRMCATKMPYTPDLQSPLQIYILTNTKGFLGAAGLLLDGLLADFADLIENNFFILPSSIHEVLLVPESSEMDIGTLSEMVCAVNKSHVIPQEVLSDHAYHYDRKTRQIHV